MQAYWLSQKRPYIRQIASSTCLHFLSLTNCLKMRLKIKISCVTHVMSYVTIRMMLIGYARISTTEQNLDLQKDALLKVG